MPAGARPLRVVVVGGGFAAAELLLALRALAEERVELELIAPQTQLPFRVASPGVPFGAAAVEMYDLAELASEVGATLRRDAAEAVAPSAHRVRLASGGVAEYDALAIAVGARARVGVPGAATFRDQRDAHLISDLLSAIDRKAVGRVAFAAPAGVSWTLPLYELALLTAARAGADADVLLVTPEAEPLEVFGPRTSVEVATLLVDRDVRFVKRTAAVHVERDRLVLRDGVIAADRVLAVPRLVGRRLPGVPADFSGFIHTDVEGRVPELPDVFAVGDVTSFRVKQGGLATQQADAIARVLAARAGAAVERQPVRRILRSRLLGADRPLYLEAELDADGYPLPSASAPSTEPPWWPAAKLFGRHLSPWMASHARTPAVVA
jgi:sulfide:quinone oxidoreductase